MQGYVKNYGGRIEHMFPLADYAREGVVAASGSDAPVTVPDPMRGIYCALTRRAESGTPVAGSQRTTLMHAIRSFTINGAYASFEEDRKGSIEVGKLADLVVLDGPVFSALPERILSMKPTLTMINGEIVYGGENEGGPEGRSRLPTATSPAR